MRLKIPQISALNTRVEQNIYFKFLMLFQVLCTNFANNFTFPRNTEISKLKCTMYEIVDLHSK